MTRAAWRNRSGAGLPRSTIVALKTWPSNRSQSPVVRRLSSMRSGWLDEATQIGRGMASSAAATPGIGRSSARNAA